MKRLLRWLIPKSLRELVAAAADASRTSARNTTQLYVLCKGMGVSEEGWRELERDFARQPDELRPIFRAAEKVNDWIGYGYEFWTFTPLDVPPLEPPRPISAAVSADRYHEWARERAGRQGAFPLLVPCRHGCAPTAELRVYKPLTFETDGTPPSK